VKHTSNSAADDEVDFGIDQSEQYFFVISQVFLVVWLL
jgi:hypothetical protein